MTPTATTPVVGSAMEYRATLNDGTVIGYEQSKTDALCAEYGIAPQAGESEYAFRLRALRHLSAKDIRKWELSACGAPVIAQSRISFLSMGIFLLFLAGAILLLLDVLSM